MDRSEFVVAIVDDDAIVCRALRRLARSLGHAAVAYDSGEALLDGLDRARPTHILIDLHMPGLRGSALIERLRARSGAARLVVMTGLETPGARHACLAAGADLFLRKPLSPADLRRILAVDDGTAGRPAP